MADYGVPQARKRTIFVGNRMGKEFIWPEPSYVKLKKSDECWTDKNYRTVEMAVGDLPWPKGNYFSHRANSQMRGPRNRDVMEQPAFTLRVRGDEFAFCEKPATGAFPPGECPKRDMFYYPCKNDFQKTMREDPPKWIKNYKKPEVVNKEKTDYLVGTRKLAVREQARLQTFPDWFEFSGTPYSQGRQIGNAVPPLFARQLFANIISQL
jgi:DNA (cytosine-5)-methyltransferase 1